MGCQPFPVDYIGHHFVWKRHCHTPCQPCIFFLVLVSSCDCGNIMLVIARFSTVLTRLLKGITWLIFFSLAFAILPIIIFCIVTWFHWTFLSSNFHTRTILGCLDGHFFLKLACIVANLLAHEACNLLFLSSLFGLLFVFRHSCKSHFVIGFHMYRMTSIVITLSIEQSTHITYIFKKWILLL